MTQLIAHRRQKDIVRKQNGDRDPNADKNDGFVDPQLQKAVEYIRERLAAQKPPEEPAAKQEPQA
jgi:hypothetical protein